MSYTRQLQDFLAYAEGKGWQFNLYVRESTTFSGPLQQRIDSGAINRIPSLGP
jgi:phenolic acid decarboxylase